MTDEAVAVADEATDEESQLKLLPDTPYRPKAKRIKLSDLPSVSVRPTAEFAANVKAVGVWQSIAVVERHPSDSADLYLIADGRRRIAASRLAEFADIPALVFPAHTPIATAYAMTLSLNMQRSPNIAGELEAIEGLIRDGANEQHIAKELGIPVVTIRKRLKLGRLIPELREGLNVGRIWPGVAEKAAVLSTDQQRQLVPVLGEKGTVRGTDVDALKRVRQTEAVASLPVEVFTSPPNPADAVAGGAPVAQDGQTPVEHPSPWTNDPKALRGTICMLIEAASSVITAFEEFDAGTDGKILPDVVGDLKEV